MQNGSFYYKSTDSQALQGSSADFTYVPGSWTNVTFAFNNKEKKVVLYLNSFLWFSGKGEANFNRNGLEIGSPSSHG